MACFRFDKLGNERVTISSTTVTDTGDGAQTVSYSSLGTFWAWVRPAGAKESFMQEQLQSRVTHKIVIRYQSALADTTDINSYKLSLDGREHNIHAIVNYCNELKAYGRAYQMLYTEEGQPNHG